MWILYAGKDFQRKHLEVVRRSIWIFGTMCAFSA